MSTRKNKQDITPPVTKTIPRVYDLHGDTRTDNYFWLRERENPEVIEYLEAENAYTEAMMKYTEAFQEKLCLREFYAVAGLMCAQILVFEVCLCTSYLSLILKALSRI